MHFLQFLALIFVFLMWIRVFAVEDGGDVSLEDEHEQTVEDLRSLNEEEEEAHEEMSNHEKKSAKQIKEDVEELFKEVDKNNDSEIERDELFLHIISSIKQLHNESTNKEFHKIDQNKNKKITLDEYSMFQHHDLFEVIENLTKTDNSTSMLKLKKTLHYETERFKAADTDEDGFLDVNEYLLFKYPVFFPHMVHTIIHDFMEDIDTNNNGVIEKSEYVNHFHIEDNKNKVAKEKSLKKTEEDFLKYDKDKNGKIDVEEFLLVVRPGYEEPARSETDYLINESDANKDSKLTLQEIQRHSHAWLGGDSLDEDNQEVYDEHNHLRDEL